MMNFHNMTDEQKYNNNNKFLHLHTNNNTWHLCLLEEEEEHILDNQSARRSCSVVSALVLLCLNGISSRIGLHHQQCQLFIIQFLNIGIVQDSAIGHGFHGLIASQCYNLMHGSRRVVFFSHHVANLENKRTSYFSFLFQ